MPPPVITEKLLEKSVEHIAYEIQMLQYATHRLASLSQSPPNQMEINAALEYFAVHARNLFVFFYTEVKNRKQDDIVAGDYVLRMKYYKAHRTPKRKLGIVTTKTAKQIAHLTYHRTKYNSRTKGWRFGVVYSLFEQTILSFLDSLDPEKRGWFSHWGI